MSLVPSIRRVLLPYCTGKSATLGSDMAQKLRCKSLDLFFQHFPLLGCPDHYSICIPLISWLGGDMIAIKLFVSLSVVFYLCNAGKDTFELPRPKGNVKLETSYLEEFGFPSTHTGASVVWATALCEVLNKCGVSRTVVTFASVGYTVLIMFCRLYLGVHSLADLVGGFQIGITTVALAEYLLVPMIQTIVVDEEASVTYSLIFRDLTVDGTVMVAVLLGGLILLYPDKRQGRSSYSDVLNMVGLTMGAMLVIGGRMRDGLLVPFGGSMSNLREDSSATAATQLQYHQQVLVHIILNYASVGVVDLFSGLLKNKLESDVGFHGGVFRVAKNMVVGIAVAMLAVEDWNQRLKLGF